jgi:hypothetical protein
MDKLEQLEPLVIEENAEQRKSLKIFATVKNTNLTIFEYCPVASVIRKADIVNDVKGAKAKLITTPDKVYIKALNYENALKKLQKKKLWFHTFKSTK